MSYRNTEETYGSVAKFLHWTVALIVIGMIIVGFGFESVPKSIGYPAIMTHKFLGLVILILMVIRLTWTITNPSLVLPDTMKPWEVKVTKMVHYALYILLFLMPISGWIMATAANKAPMLLDWSFPLPGIPLDKPLAKQAAHYHEFFGFMITGLIILHTAASLKHHFIDKDQILKRMMPGK